MVWGRWGLAKGGGFLPIIYKAMHYCSMIGGGGGVIAKPVGGEREIKKYINYVNGLVMISAISLGGWLVGGGGGQGGVSGALCCDDFCSYVELIPI